MRRLSVLLVALAAGAAWAANDGSTEGKAKELTPAKSLKSTPVTLVREITTDKYGIVHTNFVRYFKMKLTKGKAYTVFLDNPKDANGVENQAAGIQLTVNDIYPKFAFNAPIAMFERTEVGDSVRFVMTGKEWGTDWDDGKWEGSAADLTSDGVSDDDFGGWDDWDDWKTPNTWYYIIRVSGNEGETATLCYGIGKHIPTGIKQNPLVLKPTTTPQITKDPNPPRTGATPGDMQFWSSNYYCQVEMKLGCRYHFTSSLGSESNALSVAYLDIDGTIRTNQEEVSEWNFAETFVPRKSGKYLVEITSTASNYVNATGKMQYWVEPEKELSKHAFRTLTADVPIDDCRPGNINAKLMDGDVNTNKYFDAIIDEDLFTFTAAKDKNYVIETTGAETNLLMRIYDSKGTVLMENTGNGSNFNVRCAISAPSKKTTYYVGVAQDFGYDDDLGQPIRKPVTIVQRTVASTNLGELRVDPVPTADGDDPAARDEGVIIPQLGADNWYDMYAFKARKNVTYAFCTTWGEENPPTNGYHLVADVYMLKSGKQKAVQTGLDILPTTTNELSNVIEFKASATTTYYVKLRIKEGYALDYPQVRLHAIGYTDEGLLGRLTVIPEGTASAKWTIDKESTKYAIGDSILLPAGKAHTVKFTSVSGYTKPSDIKSVMIPETNTVTIAGVDARYVDSVEAKRPNDNTTKGATKWTLKQNKATSYTRTLWFYGKGGAENADPADYYVITPKDGRYYQFSFAQNGCNAAFDIYRADGTYFASNVTAVAKLQLPTSKSKYYVIVHRDADADPADEGIGNYKITGQYADVGTISFAKTSVSVKDNANTVKLTVKRSAKDGKVAVRWYTVDGTAKAGEHYVADGGVLAWAAKNKSNKTITIKMIPKLGAWYDGGDKNFTVVLEPVDIGEQSDYVAQIKTPECLVTRTETGLDKKKREITQESVYAKAAAKPATVKKTENAPLETGVFYGCAANEENAAGLSLTNGFPEFASVTLTSAISKSKTNLTAKAVVAGKSYTFKATGWDGYAGQAVRHLEMTTKVNKKVYTNTLDIALMTGCTTNESAWVGMPQSFRLVVNVPDANGKNVQSNMLYMGELYRRNAGIQDYLNAVTNFAGYYTMSLLPRELGFMRTDCTPLSPAEVEEAGLPMGNGYLTFTVSNKGTVKVAGKLADGTSISTSVTAAPILKDAGSPLGWKMLIPLYSAKSPYVLCGEVAIRSQNATNFQKGSPGVRPDGRAWDLYAEPRGGLFWNNDNGALTYDGLQGWRIVLNGVGGWYDKIVNLQSYYRDYAYQVGRGDEITEFPKEVLPSGYTNLVAAVGPDGEGVELSGNGMATASRKLVKNGKTYKFDDPATVNPCNVKVKFARATGIVSGTFSIWGENDEHTKAKEVTGFKHYGVLTMDRKDWNDLETLYFDYEVFTAGFLLKDVKIPVTKKKTRTWKFSTPFDIVLPKLFDD